MEKRIKQIMEREKLTASKFADTIGVQRSSISHILSGRNKPSLELINKILDCFPDISTDWLLLGKGSITLTSGKDLEDPARTNYAFEKGTSQAVPETRVAVKIVVFYSDNSFEEFLPGNS